MKRFYQSYFVFFSIAIFLKVILLRYLLFNDFSLMNIFWYEMSFILMVLLLIESVSIKLKFIAYFLFDFTISVFFFSLVLYERYFGVIPTYHDLGQLDQAGSISESAMMMISKIDVLFFVDLLMVIMIVVIQSLSKRRFISGHKLINSKLSVGVIVVCVAVSYVHFWTSRDESILDHTLFAKQNGVFNAQLVKLYQDEAVNVIAETNISQMTSKDIIELKGNDYIPFSRHNDHGIAEGKNLINIQIESLQNFVIGMSLNGQEITPNINDLIEDSIYFNNVYQQIGAGNTSDAEFIMNTSIYPIGDIPSTKHVGNKTIPSMPRILSEAGYTTATFHAHDITYWDRNILYPALGFDEWYAMDYYDEEDVVGFGPSDGYFFNKTMDQLKAYHQKNEPFYAHLLTLTSHSPFELPSDKIAFDLPSEYEDTLIGHYIQSIHYTDHELGLFIKGLKENNMWKDSVVALYGDHSGVHGQLITDQDVELLKKVLGHPYSLLDRFNIPFIVSVPEEMSVSQGEIDTIGGQLDMMPTLLNLLGMEPPELYFGQDLLQYEHNLFGMRYYLPTGSLFNDEALYIPETSKRETRIYDLTRKDRFNNLSDPKAYFNEDIEKMLQIYEWSDAYFETLE
ncbi:LTA synthase family protein [Lentibacillus saliphilus]|uniref:LTA synthase family protein n=1 Tax=Lentibacillus saliphilus TaxID=2737028 RepID=UPI001C30286A|nr:LTA synthase family protein [Lentibacillus saliphilus]